MTHVHTHTHTNVCVYMYIDTHSTLSSCVTLTYEQALPVRQIKEVSKEGEREERATKRETEKVFASGDTAKHRESEYLWQGKALRLWKKAWKLRAVHGREQFVWIVWVRRQLQENERGEEIGSARWVRFLQLIWSSSPHWPRTVCRGRQRA